MKVIPSKQKMDLIEKVTETNIGKKTFIITTIIATFCYLVGMIILSLIPIIKPELVDGKRGSFWGDGGIVVWVEAEQKYALSGSGIIMVILTLVIVIMWIITFSFVISMRSPYNVFDDTIKLMSSKNIKAHKLKNKKSTFSSRKRRRK